VYYNPILDEPFGVCSRNLNIKRDENNGHWKVALRHDLENKMKHTVSQGGFVIQGELAGPGIQKNRMELKELELFVFDIFDIATHNYLSVHDMQQICATFGLKTVDIIGYGGFQDMTVDDWIEYAEGDYSGTSNPREGIVVRACEPIRTETLDGHRLGFKVLNNQYLLKEV
jgi:RNA ligase (TIGR02306 family)